MKINVAGDWKHNAYVNALDRRNKTKEMLVKISLTRRRVYLFMQRILSSFENKWLLIIEHYRELVMDIYSSPGDDDCMLA